MAIEDIEHRGRDLPWLPIVRFHKEIACRAEESFFSLSGDDQAERWSSLIDFEPDDLGGPWTLGAQSLRSQSFQIALEQGQHETVFIGGPCYVAWENVDGKWWARWRPILYREVEITRSGDSLRLVPRQAHWQLCPLVYSLLDRLNASPGSLESLADTLVEKAASQVASGHAIYADAVVRALIGAVPEVESEIRREIRPGAFKVMPTPWVVFAPANRFSALTRYLIRDYESLEGILADDASRLGGLSLLDDRATLDREELGDVLPLVPLNTSQEAAVRAALGTRPLTVISGPPGCGKSQVAVSLLLNCWANGVSVLFASNNNKAVDVVRERLDRFESEFPVAVRAGSRKHNNVVEVLRRTLNMAAAVRRREASADPTALRRRRAELRKTRKHLEAMLASKLPQRIDETLRTALTSYSNHHTRVNEADERKADLASALHGLSLGSVNPGEVARDLAASHRWLVRLAECEAQAESAAARSRAIQAEISMLSHRVHASLARVGWAGDAGAQARWLLSGPAPELVLQWEQRARELFGKPLEQDLHRLTWRAEFERWSSEDDAARWSADAKALADDIRGVCGELAPTIEKIERLRADIAVALRDATDRGIPKTPPVEASTLSNWSSMWAEVCSLERGLWDLLPWSRRNVLDRQLRKVEGVLRTGLPISIWSRIGTLNDSGREKLAEVVVSCQQLLEATARWTAARDERETIDKRLEGLRTAAGRLRVERVPTNSAVQSWQQVGADLEERAKQASLAAVAWRKRKARESAEAMLRAISVEWIGLASGSPVKDAWRCGLGKVLDDALQQLAEQPSADTLLSARRAFYATSLPGLAEPWLEAIKAQNELATLQLELERMPILASRVAAWASEREKRQLLPEWSEPVWPTEAILAQWDQRLSEVGKWCERWATYIQSDRPALMADAGMELDRAKQALQQAGSLLPVIDDNESIRKLVDKSIETTNQWPTAELTEAFRAYSPEMIGAQIDGIDADLESRPRKSEHGLKWNGCSDGRG